MNNKESTTESGTSHSDDITHIPPTLATRICSPAHEDTGALHCLTSSITVSVSVSVCVCVCVCVCVGVGAWALGRCQCVSACGEWIGLLYVHPRTCLWWLLVAVLMVSKSALCSTLLRVTSLSPSLDSQSTAGQHINDTHTPPPPHP